MVRVRRHHDVLSLCASIQSVARAAAIIAFGLLQSFILIAVEKVLAGCAPLKRQCDQAVSTFAELSYQHASDKAYRSGKRCCRTLPFART